MTLRPTLPGKVQGVISLDPPQVQCHDCEAIYEARTIAQAVLLSGQTFHLCNTEAEKVRRCRPCKAASVARFGCLCGKD